MGYYLMFEKGAGGQAGMAGGQAGMCMAGGPASSLRD